MDILNSWFVPELNVKAPVTHVLKGLYGPRLCCWCDLPYSLRHGDHRHLRIRGANNVQSSAGPLVLLEGPALEVYYASMMAHRAHMRVTSATFPVLGHRTLFQRQFCTLEIQRCLSCVQRPSFVRVSRRMHHRKGQGRSE
jgi:hypothetical protein